MRSLRNILPAALLLAAGLTSGCERDAAVRSAGTPETGNRPERVVCFAPNIAETVFALGQGHRVVGVSSFCDYPPEVRDLPAVGGHIDPDFERIAMLRPDLMLLQGEHGRVAEFANMNSIRIVHVDMDSIAAIDDGIRVIGDALGCPDEATALRARIRRGLDAVSSAVETFPRQRTLLVTSRDGVDRIYTVGDKSFISELAAIAGGDNVYSHAGETYFEASKETIVASRPEAIIEFYDAAGATETQIAGRVAEWKPLAGVPAVDNGRVLLITDPCGLVPGPRIAKTAALLAEALHPDADVPDPS